MTSPQPRYGRRAIRCARSTPIATRTARQRICSSPATQVSVNWLVINVCLRAPVSGFTFVLTAVLVELWKGWPMARSVLVRCCVFMAAMVGLPLFPVHVHFLENRT